jgi:hypothetical protein
LIGSVVDLFVCWFVHSSGALVWYDKNAMLPGNNACASDANVSKIENRKTTILFMGWIEKSG